MVHLARASAGPPAMRSWPSTTAATTAPVAAAAMASNRRGESSWRDERRARHQLQYSGTRPMASRSRSSSSRGRPRTAAPPRAAPPRYSTRTTTSPRHAAAHGGALARPVHHGATLRKSARQSKTFRADGCTCRCAPRRSGGRLADLLAEALLLPGRQHLRRPGRPRHRALPRRAARLLVRRVLRQRGGAARHAESQAHALAAHAAASPQRPNEPLPGRSEGAAADVEMVVSESDGEEETREEEEEEDSMVMQVDQQESASAPAHPQAPEEEEVYYDAVYDEPSADGQVDSAALYDEEALALFGSSAVLSTKALEEKDAADEEDEDSIMVPSSAAAMASTRRSGSKSSSCSGSALCSRRTSMSTLRSVDTDITAPDSDGLEVAEEKRASVDGRDELDAAEEHDGVSGGDDRGRSASTKVIDASAATDAELEQDTSAGAHQDPLSMSVPSSKEQGRPPGRPYRHAASPLERMHQSGFALRSSSSSSSSPSSSSSSSSASSPSRTGKDDQARFPPANSSKRSRDASVDSREEEFSAGWRYEQMSMLQHPQSQHRNQLQPQF